MPFGESVFAKKDGIALQYNSGTYRMITQFGDKNLIYLEKTLDDKVKLFNAETDTETFIKNKRLYDDLLKTYIQFYRNGLIENSWVSSKN